MAKNSKVRAISMAEIRQYHREHKPEGYHDWFSRGASKFANTLYGRSGVKGPGGVFFVTGARMDETFAYHYRVHRLDLETGRVTTLPYRSPELGYTHRDDATDAARKFAGGVKPCRICGKPVDTPVHTIAGNVLCGSDTCRSQAFDLGL